MTYSFHIVALISDVRSLISSYLSTTIELVMLYGGHGHFPYIAVLSIPIENAQVMSDPVIHTGGLLSIFASQSVLVFIIHCADRVQFDKFSSDFFPCECLKEYIHNLPRMQELFTSYFKHYHSY